MAVEILIVHILIVYYILYLMLSEARIYPLWLL